MQKLRRGLALLLTALMLVTLLPATALAAETGGQEVMSLTEQSASTAEASAYSSAAARTGTVDYDFNLMPMAVNNVTINLRGYLVEELAAMKLSTLLTAGNINRDTDDKVVLIQDGVYTVLGEDEDPVLDLTGGWGGSYDTTQSLQLIVGDGDQLNPAANTGYNITMNVSGDGNLFDGTKMFPTADTTGTPISTSNVSYTPQSYDDTDGQFIGHLYLSAYKDSVWDGTGETVILFGVGDSTYFDDLTISGVYTGIYHTKEALQAAITAGSAKDVTSGYQADYTDGNNPVELTAVLSRDGSVAAVRPVKVYMYVERDRTSSFGLYNETGTSVTSEYTSYTDTSTGARVEEYMLLSGNAEDATYYFRMRYYHHGVSVSTNASEYAYAFVGDYRSLNAAGNAVNVADDLFGTTGYAADYSGGGVTFTIFEKDGTLIEKYQIIALPYEEPAPVEPAPEEPDEEPEEPEEVVLPAAPVPNREDTYFHADGALLERERAGADGTTETYTIESDTWVMPYNVDGYYYGYPEGDQNFGCQTVFLLTEDENGQAVPVTDTTIYPTFTVGNKFVKAYAGHSGSSGQEQISGKTPVENYSFGSAVQYSAASGETALKNYWVTFVTQYTGGAKLYVNAANVNETKDEETGNPVREVYLDSAHGYYHDVFIANIGDAELSGLNVELSADAQNVQLSDYWTIRDGSAGTLAPFTTTENGQMKNIARIRLEAIRDENGKIQTGDVSGTLTISAANGQKVVIKLVGTAGKENIVTETIADGVKYVPYASVIQTSVMGASSAVNFKLVSGELPEGVDLFANGKLYGVPMEYGTFTFTVQAYFARSEWTQTKEFTIKILDNTDENVWNATDKGYDVLNRVPEVLTSYTDQVFRSKGEYGYFYTFFLDGEELIEGKDYFSEPGSTKITIRAQTFRDAGTGTHTIAAEFRTNTSDTNTVKKAAQNYTVPGGGGGGGNMSSVNPPKPSVKPGTDDTQDTDGIFRDVSVNDWFYADVDWAYQEKLMIGVSEDLYAPDKAITSAMVVTVLARLDGVDLTAYEGAKYPQIEAGQWYTSAANWAMEMQLLEGESFDVNAPVARGDFAEMLVKYLRHAGIDCTLPENLTAFADADLMTEAENDAFQVLYDFGIFKGVGGYRMDPQGSTTRAQLAALLHRLSVFVENQK